MPVILPVLPLWMTPRAADDEHTDLSNGIAVPLQVKVRPPESGRTTFFAVSVWVLMPAAVTGCVEPFMMAASVRTGVTPEASLLLTLGFGLTLGKYFLMMAPYVARSALDAAVVVVVYEPASALSSDVESRMLGSWHVESTYRGNLRASVLYACRKELQNVTSPTMPSASAPPATADCSCRLMSAVAS